MKLSSDKNELKKMQRASLLKMGAIAIIVIIFIVFSSVAWFTMSREVEGSGVQMTSSDLPFEIAAYGTKGVRNVSILSQIAASFLPGESYPFNNKNYCVTNGNTDSLRLQYSTGESDIGPGDSGVCDLYVKSKIDGELNLKIDMNVIAYAYADKYVISNGEKVSNNNGGYETTSTLVAVSDINTTDYDIESTALMTLQKATDYLSGHIMFFENTSNSGANYTYVKPLTTCTRECKIENVQKGGVYPVPIYWMWPNTLGQLALQTNAENLRIGTPVVEETTINLTDHNETDKELMLAYLWSNKNNIFADVTSITNTMIYSADTKANFDTLSEQYNAADYEIGTRIAYFLIELTVSVKE